MGVTEEPAAEIAGGQRARAGQGSLENKRYRVAGRETGSAPAARIVAIALPKHQASKAMTDKFLLLTYAVMRGD